MKQKSIDAVRCFECCCPITKEDPFIYDPFVHAEDGEPLGTMFFHLNCWVMPDDEPLHETASRLSLLLTLMAHGMRDLVEGYDPECGDAVLNDLQESWQRLQDTHGRLTKHAQVASKA